MTTRPLVGDDLLREMLAELREIRALLAQARVPPPRGDRGAAQLLRVIAATMGDRVFTAGEVITNSELSVAAALREALVAALGAANARALGKLLRRVEGLELDGMRVQRCGQERDGVVWRVTR